MRAPHAPLDHTHGPLRISFTDGIDSAPGVS
jgi:hypothetical protein